MCPAGKALIYAAFVVSLTFFALAFIAESHAAGLSEADIEALRKRGEIQGWTFTVGQNEATKYKLEDLC